MSNVVPFVTPEQADKAWEHYAALARQVTDNPKLMADRKHCEEMLRAHRRFAALFNRLDAAS